MDNCKQPSTINGILINDIAENAKYFANEWHKHGFYVLGITGDTRKDITQAEHQTYSSAFGHNREIGYPKNEFVFSSDEFKITIPNYISQALVFLTATIEIGTANPSRGRFVRINQHETPIGQTQVIARANGVDFERYNMSCIAIASNRFADEDETEFANDFSGLFNLCEGDAVINMQMGIFACNYY